MNPFPVLILLSIVIIVYVIFEFSEMRRGVVLPDIPRFPANFSRCNKVAPDAPPV